MQKAKAAKAMKSTKKAKKMAPKVAVVTKSFKIVKDKPMTKSEILSTIADATAVTKRQVGNMLEALEEVISCHIKKGAIGSFSLPGILKLYVVRKPATKARKGINPFTGQETMFKAKPARNVVKIKALKKLKEKV